MSSEPQQPLYSKSNWFLDRPLTVEEHVIIRLLTGNGIVNEEDSQRCIAHDPVTHESFWMRRNLTREEGLEDSHENSHTSSSARDSMGGHFENASIRDGANPFFRDNEDNRTKAKTEDHKKTKEAASITSNKDETEASDTDSFIDISATPSDSTETVVNESASEEERSLLRQLSWTEKEQITKDLDPFAKIGEVKPRSSKKGVRFLFEDGSESENGQEPRQHTAAVNINAASRFRDRAPRSRPSQSNQTITHTNSRENRGDERSTYQPASLQLKALLRELEQQSRRLKQLEDRINPLLAALHKCPSCGRNRPTDLMAPRSLPELHGIPYHSCDRALNGYMSRR